MYGEYLAELTGDINSASRPTSVIASKGSLGLQSPMYEEEAFSEAQGKEVLEWDYQLEECEKGESPYAAGDKMEAECIVIVGPAPAAPAPVTLTAVVSGAGRDAIPWPSSRQPPTKANCSWWKPRSRGSSCGTGPCSPGKSGRAAEPQLAYL